MRKGNRIKRNKKDEKTVKVGKMIKVNNSSKVIPIK